MVNLTPQIQTIAALVALPKPASLPANSRIAPTELQSVMLKDITIKYHSLESDSDFHLIMTDSSGNSMIGEVPFPKCVSTSSPFYCPITHARGTVETSGLQSGGSDTVTVIGVPFFDFLHGQTGVAPNGIELHPILSICFGQGCTPPIHYLGLKNPIGSMTFWLPPAPLGSEPWPGMPHDPYSEQDDDEGIASQAEVQAAMTRLHHLTLRH
jgi:hypothetical protein